MKIKPAVSVISPDRSEAGIELDLQPKGGFRSPIPKNVSKAFAYAPFINAHDHLVGNWFPRTGDNRPYVNSHIWVEDMRHSFAYEERNRFWLNDGSFRLTEANAYVLSLLGAYKNLFSGCAVVQDHAPLQPDAYYDGMPLTVIKAYRQCHSITLGNWWGGASAEEEMRLSREEMPFIIHLGEGTDDTTRLEFSKLKKRDLLRPNLLMIHGIALSAAELLQVASSRASLCWCPSSNFYLIGKTLDIETSLKLGINIVLGTDSTQTGGINILDEFATAHQHFPAFPLQSLYAMLTVNAAKALYLPDSTGVLNPDATSDLLLMDALDSNPFANLLSISSEHIRLLLHNGVPLYGDIAWMDSINCDTDNYTLFSIGKRKKFVLGNPLELNARIDAVLGYHKDFPYLPF